MAEVFLRHKLTGYIHGWTAILATNPIVEEVSEEVAFPERFLTKTRKSRKKKSKLDLATDEKVVTKATPGKADKSELNAEASVGI